MTLHTLITEPAKTASKFIARLDGVFVCQSDQPLLNGARELLKRGFSPDDLLTMRHAGSAHDSFEPLAIREWAQWTISETDRDGMRRQTWRPRPEGPFLPTGSPESEAP